MSEDVCLSCSKAIVTSNKGDNQIKCIICQKNFHNTCVNMTPTVCRFLNTNDCLWPCNDCRKNGNVLQKLIEDFNEMKIKLDNCESKIKSLEEHRRPFTPNTDSPLQRKRLYSNVLTNTTVQPQPSPKVQRVMTNKQVKPQPVIVIQTKNEECKKQIDCEVKKVINPLVDPIQSYKKTSAGKIVISCRDSEALETVKKKLIENMRDEYEIDEPKSVKPAVRIIGVNDLKDATKEEIIKYIRQQNSDVIKETSEFEIFHMHKSFKNGLTIIAQTDYTTFKALMAKKKLFISFDSCPVYEHINLQRCFRCSKFGHLENTCKSETFRCAMCSDNHPVTQCQASHKQCPNCLEMKTERNLPELSTDHYAWSDKCPVMQRRLNSVRKKTTYQE